MMMTNGLGMGLGGFGKTFMLLFTLAFVSILGVFLVMLVRGVGQWSKNNRSPQLTVGALVTAKRTHVSHHRQTARSTAYYATFQVQSGDRMEIQISGSEYGLLAEGDRGYLTFQGTRYLGFEREQQE